MNKRKTSLDLLRIFATFQVVSFHCYAYPLENKCYHLPLITEFFYSLTTTCNVHFMLISSYITSTSKYTFAKQMPLILETIFYSVFSYFSSIYFFNLKTININTFLFYLLPIANSVYWYTGPYLLSGLICSLIYPTLQKHIKKFHFWVIIIIFFLYCIQFVGYYKLLGLYTRTYSTFLVISLIGCFLRFYEVKKPFSFFVIIFLFLSIFKCYTLIHETNSKHWYIRIFWLREIWQPLTMIFGISSFLFVIKIDYETKYEKYIQKISELSFPIYLIHLHPENKFLWYYPLKKYAHEELNIYWKRNLLMTLKVYFVCSIIEVVRKEIFNTFIYNRKYYRNFCNWLNKITVDK